MHHFLYLLVYLQGNIFPSWVTISYIGKRPLLVYNAKLKAQVVPNDLTLYSLHFAHTVFRLSCSDHMLLQFLARRI